MKVLSDRTKIAAAINFNQYPVIRIDLSKTDLYGVVGAPVRIDNGTFTTGEPYFVRGYLRTFKDENVLTFDAGVHQRSDREARSRHPGLHGGQRTPPGLRPGRPADRKAR